MMLRATDSASSPLAVAIVVWPWCERRSWRMRRLSASASTIRMTRPSRTSDRFDIARPLRQQPSHERHELSRVEGLRQPGIASGAAGPRLVSGGGEGADDEDGYIRRLGRGLERARQLD